MATGTRLSSQQEGVSQPWELGDAGSQGRPRILAALGALLLLGAFFLLPWLCFGGAAHFDARAERFWRESGTQYVVDRVPWLSAARAAVHAKGGVALIERLPTPQQVRLGLLVRESTRFSGYQLLVRVKLLDELLRIGLWLALVSAALSLGWLVAFPLLWGGRARQGTTILRVGVSLSGFLFLLWFVPTLDSFGIQRDLGIALIVFLSSAQVGPGIWWALLGLLAMAAGGVMELARQNSDLEAEEAWEDEIPGRGV